jgi:predicted metal-dependent HD superfamily phosphohydrolase
MTKVAFDVRAMNGNENIFRIDDAGFQFLKDRWDALASRYTDNGDKIDSTFNRLVVLYSEKHRAYHNLSHIRSLLSMSESFKEVIRNTDAVEFSIWFHDAIYDTRRSDNEEKSADLAIDFLAELGARRAVAQAAREMILATKTHASSRLSEDAKLFLDLDLSILGAEKEIYAAYSKAIRKEYSWVPYFLYRRSRKKILLGFLQRGSIYLTEHMRGRAEFQARRNIEGEMADL